MIDRFKDHLQEAADVLAAFFRDAQNLQKMEQAAQLFVAAFQSGGKVISCGNGGSMSDAIHFAEELSGKFREERPPLAAMAISDPGYLSCVANDYGYNQVFARFCEAHLQPSDVLLAISTSGNSANVLAAIAAAKQKGAKVVGLAGKNGGAMAGLCDVLVVVPHNGYADRIQEVHIKIIHCWIDAIERELF
jgi:D-sedoheptulose 7-phosphate isomerase